MSTWPNRGASGGPCGGLEEGKTEQPKQSDHAGLTQANRPPRKPVRFRQPGRRSLMQQPATQPAALTSPRASWKGSHAASMAMTRVTYREQCLGDRPHSS